jgi:Isochorismatase family
LAGEPLVYGAITALIVVDEPSRDCIDRDLYQLVADGGVAIARAGAFPLLDLRVGLETPDVFLVDEALMTRIKELNRRVLIICGGLLEGAVTQLSLTALMEGYDVFVPADLTCTAEPDKEHLFFSRITSCGGNILTYRQIILELLSGVKDAEKRGPFEVLLNANFERFDKARIASAQTST